MDVLDVLRGGGGVREGSLLIVDIHRRGIYQVVLIFNLKEIVIGGDIQPMDQARNDNVLDQIQTCFVKYESKVVAVYDILAR